MTKELMLRGMAEVVDGLHRLGAGAVKAKGVAITDEASLHRAADACWHDPLSDADLCVELADAPRGWELLRALGLEERLLGASLQPGRDAEVLRVVLTDGFRMDLICTGGSGDAAPPPDALEAAFVAVQALAKLLRRDHLIAAHLAHRLLMDSLVRQMVLRDEAHGTNHHRFGYAEELDYRGANISPWESLWAGEGETHRHVAELLARAVACLMPERAGAIFGLWRVYREELKR